MPMTRAGARNTLRRFVRRARPLVGRRLLARRRIYRKLMPRYPTFTETVRLGRHDISIPAAGFQTVGQMYVVPQNDISQWANYAELYNQFRVDSITYILMPCWTAYDPEWGTSSFTQPRLVYAIQNSSGAPNPASEQDILNDNGSKIVNTVRPLRIRMRPVAGVQDTAVGGATFTFTNNSRRQFYSTIATQPLSWQGLAYSCTINGTLPANASGNVYTVYAKVRCTFRDPK